MRDQDNSRLLRDESFLNYCFGRNAVDVRYWENWLQENPDQQERIEELKSLAIILAQETMKQEVDEQYALLRERIHNPEIIQEPKRLHFNLPFLKIGIAASILLMSSIGLYYLLNNKKVNQDTQQVQINDIAPGHSGATLTLANGKKIKLTNAQNGQLAKEAGVTISKSANGQVTYTVSTDEQAETAKFNTLSTSKGETYIVVLPDNSKVWLNAASSLTYSTSLNKDDRRLVVLDGEAYFQVAKDKAHPFVVRHGSQDVEVLGTHFNISAYAGEPVKTTLEEGSVKVSLASQNKIIAPGQQVINNGSLLTVKEADLEEVLAWKNGNFIFTAQGIQNIMPQLERWYNIDVEYEGAISQEVFYANISRYKNISQVLKMLEKTKAVHFTIKGRRITIRE